MRKLWRRRHRSAIPPDLPTLPPIEGHPYAHVQCVFCDRPADATAEGDAVTLHVTRENRDALQLLFAHMTCLERKVPIFERELFED